MNRRIIGLTIISIGFLLLALIVYFVFLRGLDFGWLFNMFGGDRDGTTALINQTGPASPDDIGNNPDGMKTGEPRRINPVPINGGGEGDEDSTEVKRAVTTDDLKRIASAFSERFGSFSNQSNFKNIEDLEIYMTVRMKQWSKNYVGEQRTGERDDSVYYGITTKAVASEISELDEVGGLATVMVSTRRRETDTAANSTSVFDQRILISFLKEAGNWKVNDAAWQNK